MAIVTGSAASVEKSFDALLLVSFGGPEGPDDVMPFLENVTRGRGVPRDRLAAVGEHYLQFGGRSPINQQNRELLTAIRGEFATRAVELPVFWGNRNWQPMLADTLAEMQQQGVRRALAFFTSPYSSYSSCRQYRENIAEGLQRARDRGGDELVVERIGPYFNHAGFVEPFIDTTLSAIAELPQQGELHVLFSTHSIPVTMAESSGVGTNAYVQQHVEVANLVADGVAAELGRSTEWSLVYQSRSGPPQTPWLEPDIDERLTQLAGDGFDEVVVVPIGFTSDHMEVIWDLDTQAAQRAKESGLTMVRAATPGSDPRFVTMVADLVAERLDALPVPDRPRLGTWGAPPDRCAAGCCPNLREPLPAIGGSDPAR